MRVAEFALAIAGLSAVVLPQKEVDANALLAAGRDALGGAKRVADARSLAIQGHTRVLIGSTGKLSEPRPLDIRVLLPAHYLRIVQDASSESRFGFAGGELLNGIRALKPGDSFGATYGPEQIGLERAWLARFLLGMLAQTTAVIRMDVRRSSTASVEVTGAGEFAAILDFDEATRLPLRVRHHGPVRFPQPGSVAPPPPQQAEIVWTFQDRRPVGGLRLAHRIVRTARDVTLEEMSFDTIRVNPPLTAKDFQK
jgi:hypothetical protein